MGPGRRLPTGFSPGWRPGSEPEGGPLGLLAGVKAGQTHFPARSRFWPAAHDFLNFATLRAEKISVVAYPRPAGDSA